VLVGDEENNNVQRHIL